MSIRVRVLILFVFFQISLVAQNLEWKVGLNYFFDNTEFSKSKLTTDQTMKGVHFTPELGVSWDSVHAVYVGADLCKVSGTQNFEDAVFPIAYYQYKTPKTTFYAGAFPRSEVLSNYSDLFFQDSISYFRPTLQGFFWQKGSKKAFFNVWLDWTSHQTAVDREKFFIGASAHKQFNLLFVDFQSYMFHFANMNPSIADLHVCDNALAHLSLGINYSNQRGIDTLLFAVGVLGGLERERGLLNGAHSPLGAVIRANAEYEGIGTQNTLYVGDPRMVFYEKYGTGFYWNNPFLRTDFYLESKWYLNVIHTRSVQGQLALKLHFSEQKVMFEQVFLLSASLNSHTKNTVKPTPYSWIHWF